MSLTDYLKNKGFDSFEGYSQQIPKQIIDLVLLANRPKINLIEVGSNSVLLTNISKLNIMEIGFNAGHSAEIFLEYNKNVQLTSFDIGRHNYVLSAKEYIDKTYPNRHTLIIGDSTSSIPKFINDYKDIKFDIIFIDGDHNYEMAKKDIDNCAFLAHKDTIVILDDTVYTEGWKATWTIGPTKIWTEYLEQNKIIELNRKDYCPGRGMSWGKYVL